MILTMNNQTSHRRSIVSELDWGKLGAIIAAILGLILIGFGGYYFIKSYFELKAFKDERDVDRYKSMLSKHLMLPKEEPIIASVKDVDKLKQEQPFYRNAINGDKVFIWKDKAVIYRPEEDRIIDFGIIIPKKTATQQPQTSRVVNITVMKGASNGSKADDILNLLGSKQYQGISLALTSSKEAATYKKTVIVDRSGENSELVQNLATELDGSVQTTIPVNEKVDTSADIVIFTTTE